MVAVVQAAHVRHRNDLARCSRLDASAHGRILAQREMRAPEMVVWCEKAAEARSVLVESPK